MGDGLIHVLPTIYIHNERLRVRQSGATCSQSHPQERNTAAMHDDTVGEKLAAF